ncbi:peptide-N(4)-(N-acetyl-beta-glucosaminyl)asparagine amidase [Anopheles maculipalpis]|uniref:peptide-N(4)-(N-acetyl-beta- glucosaminyl)asparagine amidase n=1 Tax=Anopheles maculipalpis TaxID=1496333 RepID=UPI002159A33C|nr:peptide-N(4)-(N-acetyl-beta-glucosaminyl)asparagine amidase [Anopheles maculipalpis]XP_050074080.1 peptide-N(4)-(N-acetyl-beta-glucosaminyl)asparagine amidase [Anopheles maculipalpis]
MAALNQALVLALESNPKESYVVAAETLLRLLDNIIREPQNAKYRTVRIDNPSIREKLLSVTGMKQLMLAIGFIESNGTLTVPSNVLLANLRRYREFIHERKELIKNLPKEKEINISCTTNNTAHNNIPVEQTVPASKPEMVLQASGSNNVASIQQPPQTEAPACLIKSSRPFLARIEFPKVVQGNNTLLRHLELLSDQVMQYEDELLLASGKSLIPIDTLTAKAKGKLAQWKRLLASNEPSTQKEPSEEDLLLEELTAWFRADFFTWVNALPCTVCGNEKTQLVRSTVEDGVRVEIYRCCGQLRHFYRYNNVEKLLQTRRGRCGEWANCFTFLCRCLGYDARYVFSTGDHVWTEVWSERRQRWIHVDPSENVLDAPLMYEHGWRKEITYVFGFSRDDVQDVSWRYSNNHKQLLQRRKEGGACSEQALLDAICKLRTKRRAGLNCTPERMSYLRQRTVDECLELLGNAGRVPTAAEREGRSSGSLEWRLQRGEQQINTRYMFIPTEEEVQAKQFNIRYCCATDCYERFLKGASNRVNERITEKSNGWESRQYVSRNIFRKEEHDWKMVYLARTEGTDEATIEWNFDFSVQGLRVKQIELRFGQETYDGAKVELYYIKSDGTQSQALSSLCECGKFTLQARLSGGKSWQHAQLFRQSKSATDEYPFEMNIVLM